jgi:hypothetical protein
MRPALGRIFVAQVVEQFVSHVLLTDIISKDGIEKAGLRGATQFLAQLDDLMDGGVIGDAIEPKNLIKPQSEQ